MPTSYTAPIGRGIEFKDFALNCARSLSILSCLRDSDGPIPEKLEPSSYYIDRVNEAKKELEELQKKTLAEVQDIIVQENANRAQSVFKETLEKADLKKKYEAMLEKVEAWAPPTADHAYLKEFMTRQIQGSIAHDCKTWSESPKAAPMPSPESWLKERMDSLAIDIGYHQKKHDEEVERVAKINKWVSELRTSLG